MGAGGRGTAPAGYCPAASQGNPSQIRKLQSSGNSCRLLRTLFAGLTGMLLSCHALLLGSCVTYMCAHTLCNKRGHALETMTEATRAGQLSESWPCFRESQSSSAECAQHGHFVTGLGSRGITRDHEGKGECGPHSVLQVGVGVRVQFFEHVLRGRVKLR